MCAALSDGHRDGRRSARSTTPERWLTGRQPLSRLQRALRTDNAWLALDAARELDRVMLADAFGVCLLLREDQRRYDRACVR
jgi:hypothetical protein